MNTTAIFDTTAQEADQQVGEILGVLNALIALIEAENLELARGMPASLASTLAEKTRLSASLEGWVSAIKTGSITLAPASDGLRRELVERSTLLTEVMKVNTTRILAAMEATQRRISAIMRAVREQGSTQQAYGANGTVRSRPAAPHGRADGLVS
ncbi:MAG: hypothetical protein P4M09_31685 [Devosia sp.]|nr:hypothetical protein [Devosia sp.]